ncbi:MAG: ribose 5-phosphate isomerase B [Clostridiales bacterium]|nr:ribose 5-phosphate isomerase B [Clostridiales bacterium]
MIVALGSDHAGFELKEKIKKHLEAQNIEVKDHGTYSLEPADYAIYAAKVGHAVAKGEAELGILCCGTGMGISIAANKVKGVRAACCYSSDVAVLARTHNNANILALGSRFIDHDKALQIVDDFISTEFSGEERHIRRLDQITDIENEKL